MMLGALGTRDIAKKMRKNDEPRFEMQLTQDLIFKKDFARKAGGS